MKRPIKKALSFLTAAMITVTASIGSITASAAAPSSSIKASQLISESYSSVIGTSEGALFVSKSSIKEESHTDDYGYTSTTKYYNVGSDADIQLVNKSGKKVKVSNTIGFTRIYEICSGYNWSTNSNRYDISVKYYEARGAVLGVGKGDGKVAVLLPDGSFLENGKYFDDAAGTGSLISVISGSNTIYYTTSGKKLTSIKTGKYGDLYSYDISNKAFMFRQYDSAKSTYVFTVLNSSGKTFKYKTSAWRGAGFTEDNKNNLIVYGYKYDKKDNAVYTYYDLNGSKISEPASTTKYALTYTIDLDRETYTNNIKILKSDGTVVKDVKIAYGEKGAITHVCESGDKLILAYKDGLFIYNRKTGKLELSDTKNGYNGIYTVTENGTAVLCVGKEVTETWGTYFKTVGYVYYNGKTLSAQYDDIKPTSYLYYSSHADGEYYVNEAKTSFILYRNDKIGLMDYTGKVVLKPKYKSYYYIDRQIAVFDNGSKRIVYNSVNGKTVLKSVRCADPSGGESYYEGPISVRTLGTKGHRIITTNSKGTKFGIVIIK